MQHASSATDHMPRRLAVVVTLLGLCLALLPGLVTAAHAVVDNTCEKAGFPEGNKVEDSAGTNTISGPWGSASWTNNESTLHLDVNDGWTVEICVKAGDGNQDVTTFTADDDDPDPTFDHGISHASWRDPVPPPPTDPTATATAQCDGTTPQVVVTVDNPDQQPISVKVDGNEVGTAAGTYDGTTGQVLTVTWEGGQLATATFGACSTPPTDPTATATAQCDGTTPQVVVTVDNPDQQPISVKVDGNEVGTAAGTYDGTTGQVLTVTWEGGQLATATFGDCSEPPPPPPPPAAPSSVTVDTSTACVGNQPTLDYAVEFTQGDVPLGPVTLTVRDAGGAVVEEFEVPESTTDALILPGLDEAPLVVTLSDADGTELDSEDVTLEDCAEVLGVSIDQPDPAPDPAPEPDDDPEPAVRSDELPSAGLGTEGVLLASLLLLGFGVALLLVDRRRTRPPVWPV